MDHSGQISAAGELAHDALDLKHNARELTLPASRRAIRSCSMAIRAVHRREFREARELIAERNRIDAALARTVRLADSKQAFAADGQATAASWLRGLNREVVETREPGGTP